jgi:glycosyltransferase involved in cell wall biosynthesis
LTTALGTEIGGRVTTINNGVRPEFFESCKSGWRQAGRLRILSVGRLIPSKNFDLVLRLVADNESTELTLLGDGPEHDRLVELAGDLGIMDRCCLLPPSDRLPEIMAEHDLFVHPSLSEGFGLVVLEAMASRLPILVADIPGVRSFAENGRTAMMFESGDRASLQSGFEAVVADAPSRQQRVQAALEKARHFTVEAVSAEYCALYDEILADGVRRSAP